MSDQSAHIAEGGFAHQPVLSSECLSILRPHQGGIYVDATFGRGGHTRDILRAASCRVIAFDQDPEAVAFGRNLSVLPQERSRLSVFHGRLSNMNDNLDRAGVGLVDGILLDLGVSSPQLSDPERGFSFMRKGPLDMRMDPSCGEPASVWVMERSEAELVDIFRRFGEERLAKRVARAIVRTREQRLITDTLDLADVVSRAKGSRLPHRDIHPATQVFQALRIAVNEELREIEQVLPQALGRLAQFGRLAVISFHSLEDRIVKRTFHELTHKGTGQSRYLPGPLPDHLTRGSEKVSGQDADGHSDKRNWFLITSRAVKADKIEVNNNPRARSARLRAIERRGPRPWPLAGKSEPLTSAGPESSASGARVPFDPKALDNALVKAPVDAAILGTYLPSLSVRERKAWVRYAEVQP